MDVLDRTNCCLRYTLRTLDCLRFILLFYTGKNVRIHIIPVRVYGLRFYVLYT